MDDKAERSGGLGPVGATAAPSLDMVVALLQELRAGQAAQAQKFEALSASVAEVGSLAGRLDEGLESLQADVTEVKHGVATLEVKVGALEERERARADGTEAYNTAVLVGGAGESSRTRPPPSMHGFAGAVARSRRVPLVRDPKG